MGKNIVIAILAIALLAGVGYVVTRPAAPVATTAAVEGAENPADLATATEETADAGTTEEATEETAAADEAAQADENYDHAAALAAASAEETAAAEQEVAEATAQEATASDDSSLLAAPKSLEIDVRAALLDRSIGNPDAPVTIIEYASMTCPHCANFHNNILPELKSSVVAEGKARMVYRDFPIDTYALRAAMMARCAPADKYFDLLEVIFKNQERWTRSENPLKALSQYGNLAGMSDEYIAACMGNKELEAALLNRVQEAQREFNIRSTPSFIFNTKRNTNVHSLSGVGSADEVKNVVNRIVEPR